MQISRAIEHQNICNKRIAKRWGEAKFRTDSKIKMALPIRGRAEASPFLVDLPDAERNKRHAEASR